MKIKSRILILISLLIASFLVISCSETESNNEKTCESWEELKNNKCELKPNYCEDDTSCSNDMTCDLENHTCKVKEVTCDLECETWEECIKSENDEMSCSTLEGFSWKHVSLTIEDEIVNGSSFMMPIDSISFGYNAQTEDIITSFGVKDEDNTKFLWKFNMLTGIEKKLQLSGTTFLGTENFCQDKNWCQFISYNKTENKYMLLGSSTDSVMLTSPDGVSELKPVTGDHLPNSMINNRHISVDDGARLLFFGGLTPTGASNKIYEFNNLTWTILYDKLPELTDNCIAYDSENNKLYSFGGRIASDSGNTYTPTPKYIVTDLNNKTHTEFDLPIEMKARKGMSCAYDSKRKYFYLLGGNIINDRWNEAENEYFNDLWVYDLENDKWSNIIAQTDPGTYSEPDNYGDRKFDGDATKPNFGQKQGKMIYDEKNDRLIIIGSIPRTTHEQLFILDL